MRDLLQSWKDVWQSRIGSERILRVRWLLNPNETPLENVEIVEQHGHIAEIRPLAATANNILPVIMIPTLVNAHTHLEFSSLSEPIRPALPFPDWISAVIQWRRSTVGGNIAGVQQGLMESQRVGVRMIGEISTMQQVHVRDLAEGCRVKGGHQPRAAVLTGDADHCNTIACPLARDGHGLVESVDGVAVHGAACLCNL